uniref:Uncharacterized protein n=1 Tax=Oryza nivara TaxID=4536 RepID=A0A0E0FWI1_ORYNI
MGWRCEKYNASSTVGVPQRRQQLWRLPHTWLLSFSMMKWYRFPQTGNQMWKLYIKSNRPTILA